MEKHFIDIYLYVLFYFQWSTWRPPDWLAHEDFRVVHSDSIFGVTDSFLSKAKIDFILIFTFLGGLGMGAHLSRKCPMGGFVIVLCTLKRQQFQNDTHELIG